MTEQTEIVDVETSRVSCNGGGGALGHPKIYLEMGDEHQITCPYCGREFRRPKDAGQKS
ncbi:MAG TPA: zinc-finger domain-containing protein [Alphaproteobacteria bacterium]|nr:zinc-finger domain-containing protein [Paracoccaceae bacterium]RCL79984.1 MAG: zinc-finger domain-containing protein [SAR116 cluster bacterium]RPH13453.1 MAG: zinc-finger domain-containing protein [Alphaproteobacteria bacterium TMED150]HBQ22456.1 zinc-finger domain-containing protein [Alphaproteobacteria bacterium]HCY48245.1 zinc-finger domain-containing protein [Alphaproteobacteria bacterium]